MDRKLDCLAAELPGYGAIAVQGADARAFLHGQLTNDIEHLPAGQARYAGWCSAKGRLLATFLVVPHEDGFLLQLARDLAPAMAKRLQMFVLRARVKVADASAAWTQFGIWGSGAAERLGALGVEAPGGKLGFARTEGLAAVCVAEQRFLLFADAERRARVAGALALRDPSQWALEEIRTGRPHVTRATQDLFVPQMVNLELLEAVDFHKGCYPGQEVVARTQYRGQLKRRMVRLRTPLELRPGQDLYSDDLAGQPSGTVVNAADGEALAVLQIATLESRSAVRAEAGGAALEVLPLPYAA